ncbi:hypothetical protein DPMN_067363, partial [Dreissena polymorpha]
MSSEHPGSHVFEHTRTIFIHIQDFYLNKYHIKKIAMPPGDHDFQATGTIFELFHDDWTINMAPRLLTRFYYSYILCTPVTKNATPLGGHVFPPTGTIFKLIQDIIGKNLVTKFHDDRTINKASCVLIWKNAPPLASGHVFKATETISVLIQDIIGTNLLTKFHEDRKINVASRVLTRFYYSHFNEERTINVASRVENAPPLCSYVLQANVTIFKLIQDIIETNLLTKFYEDWTINEKCLAPWWPYIIRTNLLTKFHWLLEKNAPPAGDIIGVNLLTKFHEDRTINVASRVNKIRIGENAPPIGSHVFQANVSIFKLINDIIEFNLLTKFHEDWTINVASRVLTRQMLTPHNGRRRTTDKRRSQKLTMIVLINVVCNRCNLSAWSVS